MKTILTILAATVVVLNFTACQTAPKKECCTPHGTCKVEKKH